VHVLDDDDEGRAVARPQPHIADHAEGALLELGAREPAQGLGRGGGAEEMGRGVGVLSVTKTEDPVFTAPLCR
jgi:hypothetical protein